MSSFIEDEAAPPFLIANLPEDGNLNRKASQFDFSSGVTFRNIDQLCIEGIITATETAVFKAKSMKLHDALKKSRENEFKLHTLMKKCLSEVKRQESELTKADQFPDNAGTEPLMLRVEIIKTYNMAMELEERVENLSYEEGLLREERKLLKRDYSRLPLSELEALGEDVNIFELIEQRFRDLQSLHQETLMEVDMLKMEAKRYTEQARISKENLEEILSEHTDLENRLNRIKAENVLASALPGQYMKETEKARKYKSDFEKKIKGLDAQQAQLADQRKKKEEELRSVLSNNESIKNEIAKKEEMIKENKEKVEDRLQDLANLQDLEMTARTEKLVFSFVPFRAKLVQKFDFFVSEKKELQQEQTKLKWERDNYLKQLKNSQVLLETAVDSVKNATAGFEKAKARFAVAPKYDENLLIRKEKLTVLNNDLHDRIAEEEQRIEDGQGHINEVVLSTKGHLKVLESSKAENLELLTLATTISEELAKAAVLSDVSSQYAEVKKERNNLVGLLQNAIQTTSSTRERLQQQANETEILLTATQKSDAELAAIRAELAQISSQRDNKRRELCKAAENVATQNEQREVMKNNLKSFEMTLNGIGLSNKTLEKACQRHSIMRKERLVGINARKAQLSAWFEDPDREGRLRMLGGVDPSQSELWIILGQLERRLAEKEEDLVEKKLIYEALGRLVDALKATTDANK
ncbi:unnamed protein product [Hymenolepis diminuta]|uniref:Coiled-coil domain-containing protein 146 n=1 Tax=Hymenolepis diminuta TaxID=6216 RepID=A0A158QBJ0_HYMDI|nr:unnamed protein product [Hymenolepis diminuta]